MAANAASARRPIVGVTGPSAGGWPAWLFTRLAVWRAGGRAVRITIKKPRDASELDALIIGGGADIDPRLYGAEPLARLLDSAKESAKIPALRRGSVYRRIFRTLFFPALFVLRRLFSSKYDRLESKERDSLESALLADAFARELPVLGICRGMQLLNVSRGGTLFQEIAGFYVETPAVRTVFPKKTVQIEADSALGAIIQECYADCTMQVNALHHQAIDRPGKNMRVISRDAAGVVYAIEDATRDFVLGVQWHPEYLPFDEDQHAIFRALVRSARATTTAVGYC
ncbi:MAG: type 1 glutamine amidotransferase [bacterium]|nr:type 1 glutamine amidotransferase [bacterium]